MNYRRFKVEKLVRDKTRERLEHKGVYGSYSYADDAEFITLLLRKLQEEAEEVAQAPTRDEQISELADLMEVVHTLIKTMKSSMQEIETKRMQLRDLRGGFDERAVCHYVDVADDNPAKEYYIAQPDKYPEIDE